MLMQLLVASLCGAVMDRFGVSPGVIIAVLSGVGSVFTDVAHRLEPKNAAKIDASAVATKSLILLAALASLSGCAALKTGVPMLSQADAIGRGLAHVVGWCDDRGIQPSTVAMAKQAIDERDYALAFELATRIVTASRAAGDPIPEQVEVTLRLAEGALAAQAIQDAARALSSDAGAP